MRVANHALRQAIREAGLSKDRLAELLDVDAKTVDRWITPGRLPRARNRSALAELLGRPEADLWPEEALEGRHRAAMDAVGARMDALEEDRRRYEQALWRIAVHAAIPVTVARRVIRYEIGPTADEDSASDTWDIEGLDWERGIMWWLLAFNASGETVPQKRTARQLEQLEAEELLDDGQVRKLPVLHLTYRHGKIWAMAIFDRGAARHRLRVLWRWAGMFNDVRKRKQDHSSIDLRELPHIKHELVTVQFVFCQAAITPEVRSAGTNMIDGTVSKDASGRLVFTFELDHPVSAHYEWDIQLQGFELA